MERSKAGTKKKIPNSEGLSHPNQNRKNNKHNMIIFYKKWKMYNKIHLTKKNKMDFNNQKRKIVYPPPRTHKIKIS